MSERRRSTIRRAPAGPWQGLLRAGLFGVTLAIILIAVLAFQFLPSAYQVTGGDASRTSIKSPKRVVYVSQIRTQEERDRAAAAVPEQYAQDSLVVSTVQQQTVDILRQIGGIRADTATVEQKRVNLGKVPGIVLQAGMITDILTLDETSWRAASAEVARLVQLAEGNPIAAQQLSDVKAQLAADLGPDLSPTQNTIVLALARSVLKPNVGVNVAATERARRAARDAVAPVRLSIEEGEMILREGNIVKPIDLEKLDAAGLRGTGLNLLDLASIALIAVLLAALLSAYVYLFHPDLLFNMRRALLLIFLIVSATILVRLITPGRQYFAYGFPLATVSMLVASLLDPRLALTVTIVNAVLFGLIGGHSLELTTLAMVGGFVGLVGAWRMERFNGLFLTGLAIAAANYLVLLGFQLTGGELTAATLSWLALVCVANGVLCAGLTLGFQSLLGHIFGITTTLALLELAHPSQPLFRRLLTDAPGTYHHSAIVANLAERAAHQIGADAMLTRVAAYYHDIGKVVHPFHFIENQMDGVNVHDGLDPKASAQLVIAHVQDGVALAERHGLPSKVRDIIEQHHGTNWASFFYDRACQNGNPAVDAEAFHYHGPRPQTIEAAIIMLADGVEATVRASREHSAEIIDKIVRKTIDDRLAQGQLGDCDLTLRDLEQIRQGFVTVLQGIFHPRLEYPEPARPHTPLAPLRLFGRVRDDARSRLRGGSPK